MEKIEIDLLSLWFEEILSKTTVIGACMFMYFCIIL